MLPTIDTWTEAHDRLRLHEDAMVACTVARFFNMGFGTFGCHGWTDRIRVRSAYLIR